MSISVKTFLMKDSYKKPRSGDFRYISEQTALCKQRAYINLEDAVKNGFYPACSKCGLYHKDGK
jgi:hypothetical protein